MGRPAASQRFPGPAGPAPPGPPSPAGPRNEPAACHARPLGRARRPPPPAGTAPGALVAAVCALVACCAAIRLARFNVSPKDGRFFCGVPTTMAAAVLGLATLIGLRLPGPVAVGAIAVLALAMVSSFPYAKLARIFSLPPWLLVLPVVGALLDYRVTFAAVVTLYLLSGPVVWLRTRR